MELNNNTMGIDIGFHIWPALSETENDLWEIFLQEICQHYRNDPYINIGEQCIIFTVGENPSLSKQGVLFQNKREM